ncbi:hypothetical protein [Helicobacter sp. UBA3407]|nr:hypothetical protein [Helicobacter sp. UBA3407]
MHSLFIFDKLLSSVPQITQKYYIDMKEIQTTMQFLSQKLGFPSPK